jgi:guanosine-3',5'-bis(diphosphate) 3'-pyrophosphohydrolase
MIRINEIIEQIRSYHPNADIQSVMKAYVYSAKVHAGQIRKSGEPYLSHPLAVAGLLAEMHLDVASICAGLLARRGGGHPATLDDKTELWGRK